MPQTGISERYGSSGMAFDSIPGFQVKKSKFRLGNIVKGTVDAGELKLLCCIKCVPNSRHSINLRYILKSFPLVVAPSTNYKVFTHFYFCSLESGWKGAETFVTKGRNNNVVLQVPNGVFKDGPTGINDKTFGDGIRSLAVPSSLWCDFGLPPLYYANADTPSFQTQYLGSLPKSDLSPSGRNMVEDPISILQPFFYQKIYRSNYVSPNLLQNNKIWFPDDISSEEWRIDFNSSNVKLTSDGGCYFVPLGASFPSSDSDIVASTVPYVGQLSSGSYNGDTAVNLWQKRYAMFPSDRFMDAKPWLVRGEEETMPFDITSLTGKLAATSAVPVRTNTADYGTPKVMYTPGSPTTNSVPGSVTTDIVPKFPTQDEMHIIPSDLNKIGVSFGGNVSSSLTANKFRALMALSIKSEIDALTNGNYNPLVSAQFGVDPKHQDFDPFYLGGTVDCISMNEITQTSASDTSPLGTQGGLASGQSQGHICDYFVRDFGYILGVMIIQPDVVYAQGIERQWTDIDQDSVFFPIYNELGFEPIKNREVYISGVSAIDNDLFGYTTRNSDMKVRMNQATGFFALPPDKDKLFSAYSQTREFSGLPALSQEMLTMSPGNIRRDYLHYPSYPAYRLVYAVDDTAILPLPYSSVPNRMGF